MVYVCVCVQGVNNLPEDVRQCGHTRELLQSVMESVSAVSG